MPVAGYYRDLKANLCSCFICGKQYSIDNGIEDLITHINFTHHVIIENVDNIVDFKKYMEHYRKKLRSSSLESFTKPLVLDVPDAADGVPKEMRFHLLGDFILEDCEYRRSLHAQRLEAAQKQQKIDLSGRIYIRHCFYCHKNIKVTNIHFLHHMKAHGFQLGHPEKLVYIEQFIEAIEDTFKSRHCLFCNAKFPSTQELVYHMEDKGHMRIHPNTRFYDQFYMINYMEFGKNWKDYAKEKTKESDEYLDRAPPDDEEEDWSCWGTEAETINCLFCRHVCRSWDGTLLHMTVSHSFDFKAKMAPYTFYEQVKIVNYIRKQVEGFNCISCQAMFQNGNELIEHMESNDHLVVPKKQLWDHNDYFIPTLENDLFLCHLDDEEANVETDEANVETDKALLECSKQKQSSHQLLLPVRNGSSSDSGLETNSEEREDSGHTFSESDVDKDDEDKGGGDIASALSKLPQEEAAVLKTIEANDPENGVAHDGGGDIPETDELVKSTAKFKQAVELIVNAITNNFITNCTNFNCEETIAFIITTF